jgi:hypothetical protein
MVSVHQPTDNLWSYAYFTVNADRLQKTQLWKIYNSKLGGEFGVPLQQMFSKGLREEAILQTLVFFF